MHLFFANTLFHAFYFQTGVTTPPQPVPAHSNVSPSSLSNIHAVQSDLLAIPADEELSDRIRYQFQVQAAYTAMVSQQHMMCFALLCSRDPSLAQSAELRHIPPSEFMATYHLYHPNPLNQAVGSPVHDLSMKGAGQSTEETPNEDTETAQDLTENDTAQTNDENPAGNCNDGSGVAQESEPDKRPKRRRGAKGTQQETEEVAESQQEQVPTPKKGGRGGGRRRGQGRGNKKL